MRFLVLLVLTLASTACEAVGQTNALIPRKSAAWKDVATSGDAARLRDWRSAFIAALDAAKKSGHATDIAREGDLLDPDAPLGGGPIPNGLYRCRVIKLGAKEPGDLDYAAYPGFTCAVGPERNLQLLSKLNGSRRPTARSLRLSLESSHASTCVTAS